MLIYPPEVTIIAARETCFTVGGSALSGSVLTGLEFSFCKFYSKILVKVVSGVVKIIRGI
jgi:hypothetical protein